MGTFRLDRLATLHLVSPALKLAGAQKRGLCILMYHHISDDPEPHLRPYYKLNTPPAIFRQQMQLLQEEGYKVVELEEGLRIIREGKECGHEVVITFDDGFESVYRHAFPILREKRWPATVFLPTKYIGNERKAFKSNSCVTWNEVREMRENGMNFGSHTHSHPKLVEKSWKEIEKELSVSRTVIEDELAEPVRSFAYPYAFPQENGDFTQRFKDLLAKVCYTSCATTRIGHAFMRDDSFQLKRLPVNICDDSELFRAKLSGAYDWLGAAQRFARWSKSSLNPVTESKTNGCSLDHSDP